MVLEWGNWREEALAIQRSDLRRTDKHMRIAAIMTRIRGLHSTETRRLRASIIWMQPFLGFRLARLTKEKNEIIAELARLRAECANGPQ